MTVINGLKVDTIYRLNEVKSAIENNDLIEDKLNVVIVISNPCLYKKRYKLMFEFINRIENEEKNVNLFIVELIYKNQKFVITSSDNKNHLQLKTDCPLWHKENMINLGIKKLLPTNWKAVAWIDGDVEFENTNWAIDTLKILNGSQDIVQLFSHCIDMNNDELAMNIVNSGGYMHSKKMDYQGKGINYWHPGYAWAITRKAYEKIGGLYEYGILGSGDYLMMISLINNVHKSFHKGYNVDYTNSILEFQKKAKTLRFGYVPGVIRHYFHGTKANRKYNDRYKLLIKYNYSPYIDIKYDEQGLLIPSPYFSEEFKNEIADYFKERNEDD